MRSNEPFPIKGEQNIELCNFINTAWTKGWLNEYSDDHYLIKAIENRLTTFIGQEQLIENNINLQGMVNSDGSINTAAFSFNFCINFSLRLQFLTKKFGEESIKSFITNQMSAGKKNYKEDTFFESLSEVSILTFYAPRCDWLQAIYEPPVIEGINNKNPEARFVGNVQCRASGKNKMENVQTVTINIEVKSPEFPHDYHINEKIAIPTILLTNDGRKEIKKFCEARGVTYLDPRVLKLRDFMNSASSKFTIPKKNEFNLLYINWSYRDFPSNSFLEAWALLTNEINGILTHPEYGKEIGVLSEAYNKISAIIVYTESLEGLMFSDFRYVWQQNGAGPRVRMWVVDERLRHAEWADDSNVLFKITGLNPSKELTQMAMLDYKSRTNKEKVDANMFGSELIELILKNAKS